MLLKLVQKNFLAMYKGFTNGEVSSVEFRAAVLLTHWVFKVSLDKSSDEQKEWSSFFINESSSVESFLSYELGLTLLTLWYELR